MNIKVSVNFKNKVKENGCCCKEIYIRRILLIVFVGGMVVMLGRG